MGHAQVIIYRQYFAKAVIYIKVVNNAGTPSSRPLYVVPQIAVAGAQELSSTNCKSRCILWAEGGRRNWGILAGHPNV